MRHLRQYIRNILLTEAANTADLLPDDIFIVVDGRRWAKREVDEIAIFYAVKDDTWKSGFKPANSLVSGEIELVQIYPRQYGECGGALKVGWSEAHPGWGPLLYDVAIEYATMKANGLMPDREEVSTSARKVWNYYINNRQDVTSHQLDNLEDELTPGVKVDNCDQAVARDDMWSQMHGTWDDSPLSKRYTKEPTTINALTTTGKLVML